MVGHYGDIELDRWSDQSMYNGYLQRCIVGFNRTTVADVSTYVCMAGSFQFCWKQWQYMYMVTSGARHVSGS